MYHTIPRWINHLFQNVRLLLTCVVLLSPTSGNPDVFDYTRSPAPIPRQHVVVIHSNKHFKTVFFSGFELLCDCRSAAPATASLLFRSCCVVVEYTPATVSIFFSPRTSPRFRNILRKFDGVWRHSNHRSLCVVLIVSLSSSTPATISPHFRSVLLRKFDGFSVIYPSFALCCAFCVVVESHSSHSSLLLRQGR
jgi:hypothetical protein